MDGQLLGQRIAAARKSHGLTQEILANRAGVERSALARIESGNRKAAAVELVRLAQALETPLAWFARDAVPAVVSRRSDSGATHESSDMLDMALEIFAGDLEDLIRTSIVVPPAKRKPVPMPRDHGGSESAACQVRKYLDIGDEPIDDIAAVAEQLGLYTLSIDLGDGGAEGAMTEVADGVAAAAVIDGKPQSGKRRMTVAHEIGHWTFGDRYTASHDPTTERLISSFAAYLLAPRAGVLALLARHPRDTARERAVRTAGRYRMSWSAVILHLRHLDKLTPAEYRSLDDRPPVVGEFARLGIRIDGDELAPPSVSPFLTAAILGAYTDRGISAARVDDLLHGSIPTAQLPPQRDETLADFMAL